MTYSDIKYKENVLRNCFKKELQKLDVDGTNTIETVKRVKTIGALWHYTHQLLMAEEKEGNNGSATTSADTMDIKATNLKMVGGK